MMNDTSFNETLSPRDSGFTIDAEIINHPLDGFVANEAFWVGQDAPAAIGEADALFRVSHKIVDSVKVWDGVVGVIEGIGGMIVGAAVVGKQSVESGDDLFGNLSLARSIHGGGNEKEQGVGSFRRFMVNRKHENVRLRVVWAVVGTGERNV